MSEGLNRVMLLGNLGQDPELRMSGAGQPILKMRMATSETYLDKNKVRQERTEWHSIVVFGKRAEALSKFLTKGARLFVEGGIRNSSYDDKEGIKRYHSEIVANNIILNPKGGDSRSGAGTHREASAPTGGGGFDDADYGGREGDDDIGF